jgi:Polysaccharide lyase
VRKDQLYIRSVAFCLVVTACATPPRGACHSATIDLPPAAQEQCLLVEEHSFEDVLTTRTFFAQDRILPKAWEISKEQASHGSSSVKITMSKEEGLAENGRERAELRDISISLGRDVWYRIDMFIPADFPIIKNNLVLIQLKQAGDANPVYSVRFSEGNMFIRQRFDDVQIDYDLKAATPRLGVWNRFVVRTKISRGDDGILDAWINNKQLVAYRGKTAFDSEGDVTYFKFGHYRDITDVSMTIFYDNFRRGTTFAEVVPEGEPDLERALIQGERKKK